MPSGGPRPDEETMEVSGGDASQPAEAVPRAQDRAGTEQDRGVAELGPGAVSYTHLDVYKRQAPYQVVVYRRPITTRCRDEADVVALVTSVLTEQVAGVLGITPEQLDPGYDDVG